MSEVQDLKRVRTELAECRAEQESYRSWAEGKIRMLEDQIAILRQERRPIAPTNLASHFAQELLAATRWLDYSPGATKHVCEDVINELREYLEDAGADDD